MGDNENKLWVINHNDVKERKDDSSDFDTVKNRFKHLNPEAARKAGAAYETAAQQLAEKAKHLTEKYAPALIEAWGGDAAQKALDQLAKIHKTANGLSDESLSAARNFKWYGEEILPWYQDLGNKMSDGIIHTGGDDDQARKLMNRLNTRAADIQRNFPQHATTDLPDPRQEVGYQGDPNGPGGPGGSPHLPGGSPNGSPKMPNSKLPSKDPFGSGLPDNKNPHLPGSDGSNFPNGSKLPGGDGSNFPGGSHLPGSGAGSQGTHLAGYDPGGLPGGGGGGLAGGGGLGSGSGLGGDPFGAGAGGGLSGGAGAGAGGIAGAGGLGAGGLGSNAANGLAGANRGGSPGMMPMHPAHNQGEKERERATWLTEDEDIWGGDGDAVPGQIG
ncbi:WXG100 family type VII secretion target [Actinoallomurus purpureus]|uniref:WXG100 family type VII secretion target n=1 Tax=Actinoallomurus purpureus TaxID=478114 RepID=UPI002093965F|nr:WXG100 family type VII secretion target [Actinoallomurus purpureus]MCO6011604.1 WXG100 family type VII secretion target [Actinoallomurus purpureus]